MSEVKFEFGDCENEDTDWDEAWDVCIREAPVLIIIQLFIQVVSAIYFTLIYYKRGSPVGFYRSLKSKNDENCDD